MITHVVHGLPLHPEKQEGEEGYNVIAGITPLGKLRGPGSIANLIGHGHCAKFHGILETRVPLWDVLRGTTDADKWKWLPEAHFYGLSCLDEEKGFPHTPNHTKLVDSLQTWLSSLWQIWNTQARQEETQTFVRAQVAQLTWREGEELNEGLIRLAQETSNRVHGVFRTDFLNIPIGPGHESPGEQALIQGALDALHDAKIGIHLYVPGRDSAMYLVQQVIPCIPSLRQSGIKIVSQ